MMKDPLSPFEEISLKTEAEDRASSVPAATQVYAPEAKSIWESFRDIRWALVLWLMLDAVLFHGGLYLHFVHPFSYSGQRERFAERFDLSRQEFRKHSHVVFLGNSMIGQGVQEDVILKQFEDAGLRRRPINLAQGGSSPRAWFHMMRHSDVEIRNTSMLVLGVKQGALREGKESAADLEILKSTLRFNHLRDLEASYQDPELARQVVVGGFFRSTLFRRDLRDLLLHPWQRFQLLRNDARFTKTSAAHWTRRNTSDWDLTSVQVDADGQVQADALHPELARRPGFVEPIVERIVVLREHQRVHAPPFHISEIHRDYLNRIVRTMHHRGVPVTFAVLPRGPFPLVPEKRDLQDLLDVITPLQGEGMAVHLFFEPSLLDQLEDPAYYKDLMHLNARGADLFSARLGTFLVGKLEGDFPTPPKDL